MLMQTGPKKKGFNVLIILPLLEVDVDQDIIVQSIEAEALFQQRF